MAHILEMGGCVWCVKSTVLSLSFSDALLSGDFMSATVFGTTIVIVNSYKKAMEIFEDTRKNTIYSSRPYVPMTGELMGYGPTIGLLPYGPTFRNSRKFFQKELGSNAGMRNFYPQEEQQAKVFIRQVLNSPDDLLEHVFK